MDIQEKIKQLEVEIKALEYYFKYICCEDDEPYVNKILGTKYKEYLELKSKQLEKTYKSKL